MVGSADTNVTGGSYLTEVLQGDPNPGAGTGSALPPPIGRMPRQETGKNSFLTDQMMTILLSQEEGDFSLLTSMLEICFKMILGMAHIKFIGAVLRYFRTFV